MYVVYLAVIKVVEPEVQSFVIKKVNAKYKCTQFKTLIFFYASLLYMKVIS